MGGGGDAGEIDAGEALGVGHREAVALGGGALQGDRAHGVQVHRLRTSRQPGVPVGGDQQPVVPH